MLTPGPPVDPHHVLGVASGADADTVRAAWRRAARRSHPDRGGDAAEFHRVRLAVEVLRDAAGSRGAPSRPTAVRHPGACELTRRWWRRRRDRARRPRVI